MARFFAEAKGDVNLAKASYLSHKFDELKEQQSKAEAERRSADAFWRQADHRIAA